MKKLYFLDEEEKSRVLSLHESATKRQYLSEQTLSVDEQIAKQFYDTGALGMGTNPDEMFNAINKITSAAQFWKVNELVKNRPKNSSKLDIAGVINDEFEYYNTEDIDTGESNNADLDKIIAKLTKLGITSTIQKKSAGIGSAYAKNTFKITSTPVVAKTAAELDATWATTYKCVTLQPGATTGKMNDGSTKYFVGDVTYFNNGRKLLPGQTSTVPYTCDEFKSKAPVVDRKKVYQQQLAARLKQTQKNIGVPESGALDVVTLQGILDKLNASNKTVAAPAEVAPVVAAPAASAPTPEQLQQTMNKIVNRPQ